MGHIRVKKTTRQYMSAIGTLFVIGFTFFIGFIFGVLVGLSI